MKDTKMKMYLCVMNMTDPPFRVLIEAEGPMIARKKFFEQYFSARRVDAVEVIKLAKAGTPIIEASADSVVTEAEPAKAEDEADKEAA